MMRKLHAFVKKLGPGLITGASDDDPSGILTYLQAGTVMGLKSLWTALFTLPLMYGIQEMCARIGLQTDHGLMRLIKQRYSKYVLYLVALVSTVVITVNIGADLSAMGVVIKDMVGGNRLMWLALFAAVIIFSTIKLSYHKLARVLKWLTLSLFCYVLTVFFIKIDWLEALRATFTISLDWSKENIMLIAAILGTTISPYLFFWQANEEAEERDETISNHHLKRFIVTKHELKMLKEDVFWGMLFSNLVTWFIIVGASRLSSLYGVSEITSFSQAALVLKPLLGPAAYFMFALGIIGTGLLAIPVLAGSVGYIIAEVFGWSEGMSKTFRQAEGFYIAIASATLLGVAINFLNIDPVQLLIYAAVLYTIITPPLIYFILRLANDKKLMGHHANSWASNALGTLTLVVMITAAAAYLLS
ncbi:MAG: divalent metal cation transporter [Candidatus Kerfeldbacteria bacterium]|nr:divalent metal cation transporter [Candidatus Kerfeldbacteria bacterium]